MVNNKKVLNEIKVLMEELKKLDNKIDTIMDKQNKLEDRFKKFEFFNPEYNKLKVLIYGNGVVLSVYTLSLKNNL